MELVTSLPKQIKATAMSTLDVFVEKGRKEGYQKRTESAIRNLVKQSLLSDDQIASAMEVTVNYVAEIRRQINKA